MGGTRRGRATRCIAILGEWEGIDFVFEGVGNLVLIVGLQDCEELLSSNSTASHHFALYNIVD